MLANLPNVQPEVDAVDPAPVILTVAEMLEHARKSRGVDAGKPALSIYHPALDDGAE